MTITTGINRTNSRKHLLLHMTCIVGISIAMTACSDSDNGGGATTGTATGTTTGTTTGTSDPAPIVSAAQFTDEFSVDSLNGWTLRHQAEGEQAQYSLLDINQTNPGMLTIVPTQTPGWFEAGKAPLIYKRVTGNFSVETSVITQGEANAALPPGNDFNAAGLMARYTSGSGENYVVVNVGRQDGTITGFLGSEAKNTTNSISALELQSGSTSGRLTLCRIGANFTVYRQLDNEIQWTQIGAITRNDFPETAQVGMMVNGYLAADIRATFDYVRMRVPATEADCTVN
ncbi:MAG: hypothetical protein V3U65_16010 [Granulosicoccaceae bacterium]